MPDAKHEQEVALLRAKLESLRYERLTLLRTAGAAAVFVAKLDSQVLPESTCQAADTLAETLNGLPEQTLREAIELIRQQAGEKPLLPRQRQLA
ncbi:MAG TPA: hypothetical protein VMH26_14435 [Burkholderiales bacterium]|nr:hypothetical protein [Burkholderiales bacterium]